MKLSYILYISCLSLYFAGFSQTKVYEAEFPLNNVKNFYINKHKYKNEYLLHVYSGSNQYVSILDSNYNNIFETESMFDFNLYEYITTFHENDVYSILYRNEGELALAIIDRSNKNPYRFIKIGEIIKKYNEYILSVRVLDNKCLFVIYNEKEKKIINLLVGVKGVIERNVYDVPQKLNYAEDPYRICSIYDNQPQELSITKNSRKNYEYQDKYFFGFRTFFKKDKGTATDFLVFDKHLNKYMYKQVPDSLITDYYGKLNNTNYTFNNGKLYLVNVNSEQINLLVLDVDDFSILSKTSINTNSADSFSVKKLYKDGEINLTGNDFHFIDTSFDSPVDLFNNLFEDFKKLSNISFKVAIAVNNVNAKEYYSIGITRETYFRSNVQGIVDIFNVPMGSMDEQNLDYQKLLCPFYPRNNGVNFQTRYFLTTIEDGKLKEVKIEKHPNGFIRQNIQQTIQFVPNLKDIILNNFNDQYYINTINKKDKKINIYKLQR